MDSVRNRAEISLKPPSPLINPRRELRRRGGCAENTRLATAQPSVRQGCRVVRGRVEGVLRTQRFGGRQFCFRVKAEARAEISQFFVESQPTETRIRD